VTNRCPLQSAPVTSGRFACEVSWTPSNRTCKVICYMSNKMAGSGRGARRETWPKTIRLACGGRGRRAGCARRLWRIGRTTPCDGRHRSQSLEPDRGEHAHWTPGAGGRGTACRPDTRGNGPGRRLRRGQRDRAEASSTVSPEEALLRKSLEGGGRRHRGLRSPEEHRLDGARAHRRSQGGLVGVARRGSTTLRSGRYPTRRSSARESRRGTRPRGP
jgi:hypothetical protein